MRGAKAILVAAVALAVANTLSARADESQSAATTSVGAADPSVPQHQPELRPLIDMPADEGFVTQLLLMRAHLRVGQALYEAGSLDLGAEHCSHPLKEHYDDLALQLEDRGLPSFFAELQALVDATKQGKAEIIAVFGRVDTAIDAAIASVDRSKRESAGFAAMVAAGLMRAAQQEYEVSLTDGRISNVIEYQDSWAFYNEARAVVGAASAALASKDAAAFAESRAQLEAVAPLWSSLDPRRQPIVDSARVARTADRIDELRWSFQ